jgi:FkbM family methyltransferase
MADWWYFERTFADRESRITAQLLRRSRKDGSVLRRLGVDPVPVRLRELGNHAVLCRPGSTDIAVLDATFRKRYHLPPPGLKPLTRILDLGSNIGCTMAHFAARFPEATVCGIELDESNVELCRKNIAMFGPRCSVIHAAVWKNSGEVAYDGKAEWGYRVSGAGRAVVRSYTVEDLLGLLQWRAVDFVKMDIEGAEKEVLSPPAPWLEQVRVLKVEIHEPYSVEECAASLAQAGFRCARDTSHPACVLAVNERLFGTN